MTSEENLASDIQKSEAKNRGCVGCWRYRNDGRSFGASIYILKKRYEGKVHFKILDISATDGFYWDSV